MTTISTLSETIVERLQKERKIQIPASWEEYWELVEEMEDQPYVLEYYDYEIHAKMSQVSDNHETLVANLIRILGNIFYSDPEFRVMGSSKVVYIQECDKAVNPDALVVKGASELMPRKKKATALTNPYIIVEVLSDSTEDEDMASKLPCYKKLASVHQIVYIDQHKPSISVYTKQSDAYHWLNEDADDLKQTIQINGTAVLLGEIYHKVA